MAPLFGLHADRTPRIAAPTTPAACTAPLHGWSHVQLASPCGTGWHNTALAGPASRITTTPDRVHALISTPAQRLPRIGPALAPAVMCTFRPAQIRARASLDDRPPSSAHHRASASRPAALAARRSSIHGQPAAPGPPDQQLRQHALSRRRSSVFGSSKGASKPPSQAAPLVCTRRTRCLFSLFNETRPFQPGTSHAT